MRGTDTLSVATWHTIGKLGLLPWFDRVETKSKLMNRIYHKGFAWSFENNSPFIPWSELISGISKGPKPFTAAVTY